MLRPAAPEFIPMAARKQVQKRNLTLAAIEMRLDNWLKINKNSAEWDNVGLLIGSGKFSKDKKIVNKILITNDLTLAVTEEAVARQVDLVVAYHPIIFKPLLKISYNNWKERVVAVCLANDIAVYSPHTSLDSIPGGLNEAVVKLLKSLSNVTAFQPIKSTYEKPLARIMLKAPPSTISVTFQKLYPNRHLLFKFDVDAVAIGEDDEPMGEAVLTVASESEGYLRSLTQESFCGDSGVSGLFSDVDFCRLIDNKGGLSDSFWPGVGKVVTLDKPVKFVDVVRLIKDQWKVDYVQVAGAAVGDVNYEVKSFGICVGSGAALLAQCPDYVDCFITGEMSHHAILDIVNTMNPERPKSVIICGHCSSERHYLPTLMKTLKILLKDENSPEIFIASSDQTPLRLL